MYSLKQLVNTHNLSFHPPVPFNLNSSLCYSPAALIIISSKQVTGEPHIQIPGRKGAQPPHEIPLQYIIYTGIEFKCTLINLLTRHITVASACMKLIIEYPLAALVSGVHHSSQVEPGQQFN